MFCFERAGDATNAKRCQAMALVSQANRAGSAAAARSLFLDAAGVYQVLASSVGAREGRTLL
jgi:hypothetical protein